MPLQLHVFDAAQSEAVKAFNRRMAAGGSTWQFPESAVPNWLARVEGSAVFQEFFVAADAEIVRGAYALQRRPARIGDEELSIGAWYLPVSEGAVDPKHALVATLLMRDALRLQVGNLLGRALETGQAYHFLVRQEQRGFCCHGSLSPL